MLFKVPESHLYVYLKKFVSSTDSDNAASLIKRWGALLNVVNQADEPELVLQEL